MVILEEEAVATPVAVSISVMLLGSIGFQMLLFYLVNWPDNDIQRYSWQVISQTISIFCAVLMFQGCNGIVEEYIIKLHEEDPIWEVSVDLMQLVVWLTALQIVLAITSGAVNELIGGDLEPKMETVELNVKSWSVLFSHLAGFAAINAWGSIQQHLFQGSPGEVLCAVPIGLVGLWSMYLVYDRFRDYVAKSDDGDIDEYEKKWGEETEEAENDVAGLSLSFLTVQAIRFALSGVLPNQEGGEDWEDSISHRTTEWVLLLCCGGFFGVMSIIVLNMERCIKSPSARVKRVIEILNNYFTFGNAWCFFYGVKWALSSTQFTTENALLHVVIALFLSASAFFFIFILDKVEDNELLGTNSEMVDSAVERIIQGFGILIGFSWEQCFDTAVGVISVGLKDSCPPTLSKLVMSFLLVLIVFPAWRLYILPTEMELSAETTEEGQRLHMLKRVGMQHYQLLMSAETHEHDLDLAHLKMKQHRRATHGLHHPSHSTHPGLKHLQVTAHGIKEVDAPEEHRVSQAKVRTVHQKHSVKLDLLS